jgi:hypothetical protein
MTLSTKLTLMLAIRRCNDIMAVSKKEKGAGEVNSFLGCNCTNFDDSSTFT